MAFIDAPHDVHVHKHEVSLEGAAEAGIPISVAEKILGPSSVVSIVKGVTFVMVELPSNHILLTVAGLVDVKKLRGSLNHPWFNGDHLGTWYFVNNGRKEDGTVRISSRMITHGGGVRGSSDRKRCISFLGLLGKKDIG